MKAWLIEENKTRTPFLCSVLFHSVYTRHFHFLANGIKQSKQKERGMGEVGYSVGLGNRVNGWWVKGQVFVVLHSFHLHCNGKKCKRETNQLIKKHTTLPFISLFFASSFFLSHFVYTRHFTAFLSLPTKWREKEAKRESFMKVSIFRNPSGTLVQLTLTDGYSWFLDS